MIYPVCTFNWACNSKVSDALIQAANKKNKKRPGKLSEDGDAVRC